jgi:membrane-associated phospholipid phosphatase
LPVPVFTLLLASIIWRAAPRGVWIRIAAALSVLVFLVLLLMFCSELKDWADRTRPGGVLEGVKTGGRTWTGPGFPSCNAMLWGGVAGLLPLLRVRLTWILLGTAAAAFFSVLRVYQGAHWLGDVAVGFGLGVGLGAAWKVAWRRCVLRMARGEGPPAA